MRYFYQRPFLAALIHIIFLQIAVFYSLTSSAQGPKSKPESVASHVDKSSLHARAVLEECSGADENTVREALFIVETIAFVCASAMDDRVQNPMVIELYNHYFRDFRQYFRREQIQRLHMAIFTDSGRTRGEMSNLDLSQPQITIYCSDVERKCCMYRLILGEKNFLNFAK